MTAAILIVLLAQADIDSLVRDLADDSLEVRERAHRKLLKSGTACIPALKKVLLSDDVELRIRAAAITDIVGRADRERTHDAEQMSALRLLNRTAADARKASEPGSAATEGARFDLCVESFDDGLVICTAVSDYLARTTKGPGKGRLKFDIPGILDGDGKELKIERCGVCSPRKVFVRKDAGPLKVRIKGDQTWFSPYHLEFKDPAIGHQKRVGDFTIEVVGFSLKVSSSGSFPYDWVRSMNTQCTYELKAPISRRPVKWIT